MKNNAEDLHFIKSLLLARHCANVLPEFDHLFLCKSHTGELPLIIPFYRWDEVRSCNLPEVRELAVSARGRISQ